MSKNPREEDPENNYYGMKFRKFHVDQDVSHSRGQIQEVPRSFVSYMNEQPHAAYTGQAYTISPIHPRERKNRRKRSDTPPHQHSLNRPVEADSCDEPKGTVPDNVEKIQRPSVGSSIVTKKRDVKKIESQVIVPKPLSVEEEEEETTLNDIIKKIEQEKPSACIPITFDEISLVLNEVDNLKEQSESKLNPVKIEVEVENFVIELKPPVKNEEIVARGHVENFVESLKSPVKNEEIVARHVENFQFVELKPLKNEEISSSFTTYETRERKVGDPNFLSAVTPLKNPPTNLLVDPEGDRMRLSNSMRDNIQRNYVEMQNAGGGNCLPQSLSQILCGDSSFTEKLRQIAFIELYRNRFTYEDAYESTNEEDYQAHIARVLLDGESLGYPEIRAISTKLGVQIIVFNLYTGMNVYFPQFQDDYLHQYCIKFSPTSMEELNGTTDHYTALTTFNFLLLDHQHTLEFNRKLVNESIKNFCDVEKGVLETQMDLAKQLSLQKLEKEVKKIEAQLEQQEHELQQQQHDFRTTFNEGPDEPNEPNAPDGSDESDDPDDESDDESDDPDDESDDPDNESSLGYNGIPSFQEKDLLGARDEQKINIGIEALRKRPPKYRKTRVIPQNRRAKKWRRSRESHGYPMSYGKAFTGSKGERVDWMEYIPFRKGTPLDFKGIPVRDYETVFVQKDQSSRKYGFLCTKLYRGKTRFSNVVMKRNKQLCQNVISKFKMKHMFAFQFESFIWSDIEVFPALVVSHRFKACSCGHPVCVQSRALQDEENQKCTVKVKLEVYIHKKVDLLRKEKKYKFKMRFFINGHHCENFYPDPSLVSKRGEITKIVFDNIAKDQLTILSLIEEKTGKKLQRKDIANMKYYVSKNFSAAKDPEKSFKDAIKVLLKVHFGDEVFVSPYTYMSSKDCKSFLSTQGMKKLAKFELKNSLKGKTVKYFRVPLELMDYKNYSIVFYSSRIIENHAPPALLLQTRIGFDSFFKGLGVIEQYLSKRSGGRRSQIKLKKKDKHVVSVYTLKDQSWSTQPFSIVYGSTYSGKSFVGSHLTLNDVIGDILPKQRYHYSKSITFARIGSNDEARHIRMLSLMIDKGSPEILYSRLLNNPYLWCGFHYLETNNNDLKQEDEKYLLKLLVKIIPNCYNLKHTERFLEKMKEKSMNFHDKFKEKWIDNGKYKHLLLKYRKTQIGLDKCNNITERFIRDLLNSLLKRTKCKSFEQYFDLAQKMLVSHERKFEVRGQIFRSLNQKRFLRSLVLMKIFKIDLVRSVDDFEGIFENDEVVSGIFGKLSIDTYEDEVLLVLRGNSIAKFSGDTQLSSYQQGKGFASRAWKHFIKLLKRGKIEEALAMVYTINVRHQMCSCCDFVVQGHTCKHIYLGMWWLIDHEENDKIVFTNFLDISKWTALFWEDQEKDDDKSIKFYQELRSSGVQSRVSYYFSPLEEHELNIDELCKNTRFESVNVKVSYRTGRKKYNEKKAGKKMPEDE